jgi:uncharacterized protein YjbI with pentapeptide repeats
MDLDAVTGELYGVPPSDFVTERDERAAQARRAGERQLADAIKRLRRPSAGAWLANLLVRERYEQVSELLAVGAELRQAQAHLANEDLRRLSKERRRVVASLAGDALELARDRGQTVSSAAARELETTLEAAMLDAGAAGELQAGRLSVALGYTGLGWAGSDVPFPPEASGTPVGSTRPDGSRLTGHANAEHANAEHANAEHANAEHANAEDANAEHANAEHANAEHANAEHANAEHANAGRANAGRAEHERLLAARAALKTAGTAVAEAGRDLEEHRGRAHEARRERDHQHQQVADLEERMAAARAGEQRAESQLRQAEKQLAEAERRARSAQDKLDKARAGLDLEGTTK